jgi:hypothetical protein
MIGASPPGDLYTHIVGFDILLSEENEIFVSEDHARTTPEISYMLENRETMLRIFPKLFVNIPTCIVSDYPNSLRRSLIAPPVMYRQTGRRRADVRYSPLRPFRTFVSCPSNGDRAYRRSRPTRRQRPQRDANDVRLYAD